MSEPTPEGIDQVFRTEHGRVVATLMRRFGDLGLAEDATSEALVMAVQRWPVEGMPVNPGAWLTTVAGRKALDWLRRESSRERKHEQAVVMMDPTPEEDPGPVTDDRLRLIFICCHPALALEYRVALTLRMLGGLTAAEIGRAFLVPEATMAKRLTRAKQKIKAANIPYRVPQPADIVSRREGMLTVLYLIFNEGYLANDSADDPESSVRADLCAEAIRLVRILRDLLGGLPSSEDAGDGSEVDGLLALMLLLEARRPARLADGMLVTLPDQDRTLWRADLIDEGHRIVRRCLALNRPGQYQYLAAINAVHTDALDSSMTDWDQIVALYDQLSSMTDDPIVALNRAVAVAELDGPQVALGLVDPLPLEEYHAWHVTRADLLRRLGRTDEARVAYDRAIALSGNAAERAWLLRRREQQE